jgi:hypothetical protein
MTITDNQFEAWLRSPRKYLGQPVRRVLLAEAKYYPVGGPEATRYFSTRAFTSAAADTPASTYYEPIIVKAPTFTSRLTEVERIWERPGGYAPASWGDIIIDNTGGSRDSWLNDGWDGRSLTLLLGDSTWPRSDFRPVLTGVSADIVAPDRNLLALQIRDKTWMLNVPLQTNRIVSFNANNDHLVPLAYGQTFNIEPPLIDDATHEYQAHDGSLWGGSQAIYTVRDAGLSLTASRTISAVSAITDTITTSANHGMSVDSRVRFLFGPPTDFNTTQYYWVISAGLTANAFRLSHTRGGSQINITDTTTGGDIGVFNWWSDDEAGTFRLVAAPAGRVTCGTQGSGPAVAAATVSAVDAGTDTITFSAPHGVSLAGTRIVFAGTVPAGIVAGASYYVLSSGLTSTAMKVSEVRFGAAVDITDTTTGATATHFQIIRECADLVEHIVTERTELTAADIDAASFSAFDALCTQTLGCYVKEFMSVATIVDELVTSVGGFWTFDLDGKMVLGRFDEPSGSPEMELLEDEIARASFRVVRRILPVKTYTLGEVRNWTVMRDGFAGAVTTFDRALLGREYSTVYPVANAVTTMHPLAPETQTVGSCLVTGGSAEATRRAGIWDTLRYVYELRAFAAPHKLHLGQVIRITHPRFGFAAGKLVTVIGMHWAPTGAGGVVLEVFA